MKVTTTGTPLHDQINLLTSAGIFAACIVNQDDYIGIRTEFVSNDDTGKDPGRPSVSLEFDADGELRILVYDKTGENPVDEITFKDGIICHESGCAVRNAIKDDAYWDNARFGEFGMFPFNGHVPEGFEKFKIKVQSCETGQIDVWARNQKEAMEIVETFTKEEMEAYIGCFHTKTIVDARPESDLGKEMVILERSNGFYGCYEKTADGYVQKFNVRASLFSTINRIAKRGYHITFLDKSYEDAFMKNRVAIV